MKIKLFTLFFLLATLTGCADVGRDLGVGTPAPQFQQSLPFMGFDVAHANRFNGSGTIAIVDFFGGDGRWGDESGWAMLEIIQQAAPGAGTVSYDIDEFRKEFRRGGLTAHVTAAFQAVEKDIDQFGIDIVVTSFGLITEDGNGCAGFTQTEDRLKTAIEDVIGRDVILVAATGDEGTTEQAGFPACVQGALSVGAVYDNDYDFIDLDSCQDAPVFRGMRTCSSGFGFIYAAGGVFSDFENYTGDAFIGTGPAAAVAASAVSILLDAGFEAENIPFHIKLNATNYFENTPVIDLTKALGLGRPSPSPPTSSLSFADQNGSGFIEDPEIKNALTAWITGQSLNGVIISDSDMKMLLQTWISGSPVS